MADGDAGTGLQLELDRAKERNAQLEAELRALRDEIEIGSKNEIRRIHEGLARDFAEKLRATKESLTSAAAQEAASTTEVWAAKWAEREREFLAEVRERDASTQKKLDALRGEYAGILKSYADDAAARLQSGGGADLAALDSRLAQLLSAKQDLAAVRQAAEAELGSRYEEALRREREADARARAEAEGLRRREVAALQSALRAAREQAERQAEEAEALHRREVATLEAAVAAERRAATENAERFREQLNARYDRTVAALEERARSQHAADMQRALEDVDRRQRLEAERQEAVTAARAEAHEAAQKHFRELVAAMRERQAKEEAARVKGLEERLRGHYSQLLDQTKQQLTLALALNDEVDEKWSAEVTARNKQLLSVMTAFEDKCRRLYNDRFAEYLKTSEKQLQEHSEAALQREQDHADTVASLQQALRHVRLAAAKWRTDYARAANERAGKALQELEHRYIAEVEALRREAAEAREEQLGARAEAQRRESALAAAERRATAAETVKAERAEAVRGGAARVRELRTSLFRMWDAGEAGPQERSEFLERFAAVATPTKEVLRFFEEEHEAEAAKSEVLQDVTRRELLRFKLRELHQKRKTASTMDTRDEMMEELAAVDARLLSRVRAWETQFGRTFLFRDAPYVDAMQSDRARMPETPMAVGAMEHSRARGRQGE